MTDLRIDPAIRVWVFLPIVLIVFLFGILRHYVFILCTKEKTPDLAQVIDSQVVIRARLLRANGKYLPQKSFEMRKAFFNDPNNGYFYTNLRPPVPQNLTTTLQDTLKSNFFNVFPMLLIGGWINVMFAGFVTTKVPFPLTLRFKPMLQAGIQLSALDASWVSSASWYIFNIFGLRPIYALLLGSDNEADQMQQGADFITGAAMSMPTDSQGIFKAEREALELTVYQNGLKGVEAEMMELNEEIV